MKHSQGTKFVSLIYGWFCQFQTRVPEHFILIKMYCSLPQLDAPLMTSLSETTTKWTCPCLVVRHFVFFQFTWADSLSRLVIEIAIYFFLKCSSGASLEGKRLNKNKILLQCFSCFEHTIAGTWPSTHNVTKSFWFILWVSTCCLSSPICRSNFPHATIKLNWSEFKWMATLKPI